jgi:hypothetical protein
MQKDFLLLKQERVHCDEYLSLFLSLFVLWNSCEWVKSIENKPDSLFLNQLFMKRKKSNSIQKNFFLFTITLTLYFPIGNE